MADIDLEIITNLEGLEELEESFTSGSKRAVKKFLARVEKRAAKILVTSAEENAPYAEGDLAGDIHMTTVQTDGALTVRVGPSKETFWGLFQEFGAPEANVPAQHWLEQLGLTLSKVMEDLGLTPNRVGMANSHSRNKGQLDGFIRQPLPVSVLAKRSLYVGSN